MYTEKFRRTMFGYFRQSDVHELDVGARSAAVQTKLRSNSWIENESTPRQIDTIDKLIAELGIAKAESLVRSAESKSDYPFAESDAPVESWSEPNESDISNQSVGPNSYVETEASHEPDKTGASELGQAIRDDLGRLGQAVQAAIGTGVVWGAGLLAVKVIYGISQGVGPWESIISPNGLIVFGIGFVFGALAGFGGD